MKIMFPTIQTQSQLSDWDEIDEVIGNFKLPNEVSTVACSFEQKDDSWYVSSDIPTDLSVQIKDITFYVHKYAILSKSGYMRQADLQPMSSGLGSEIRFDSFPGGPAIFGLVVKFCYCLPIDLSTNNVAPLRCAAEFLEMTEEFEDANLISKTEAFVTFIVLTSWRDSIIVLKTCENLSPWAENLQIVRRCCDSISWKVFQDRKAIAETINDEAWWVDDVVTLRIDHFTRIMAALKAKGVKPDIIGSCIMHYAEKWLPRMEGEAQEQRQRWYGKTELQLSITSGKNQEGNVGKNKEQRTIIENLISILPPQKETVTCKCLLWLLKMATIYSVTPALISELEKRAGSVLQYANVQDLLIPTCQEREEKLTNSPEKRTMHNIDAVQRIVEYFLMHEQGEQQQHMFQKLEVSKLLDSYLAEIAKDTNLTVSKFQVLAEVMPENARICHDGLYRAIDTYLKTHSLLSEHERKRMCRIMNCQKLSLDACMHVAQNERLPLKIVVQVLFSEQVKMRASIQSKQEAISGDNCNEDESWLSAKREINNLKTELKKVKDTMSELQRDYSELQREYERLANKKKGHMGWSLGWKKSLFSRKAETEGGRQDKFTQEVGNRIRRQSIS